MREADMKCKVATWLLPVSSRTPVAEVAFPLHFSALAGRLTRSRKVVAEEAFCYEFASQPSSSQDVSSRITSIKVLSLLVS